MFRNHFKITLRLLMRNKQSSFINISGLAIGLTACILILLYIQYELSYDRYNNKADRIFRVTEQSGASGKQQNYAETPEQLGPLLQSNFSQIEFAARLVQMSHHISAYDHVLVTFQSKQFYEKNLYFTDPSLFKIFTLPVIEGDVEHGLSRPNTIFISSSIAKKYFGEHHAIGQILKIGDSQNYEVTGVFKDFPSNSHIHADFLASFASITSEESNGDWHPSVYSYLLLKNKQAAAGITKQFPALINKYIPVSQGKDITFSLMLLTDIHLYSNLRFEAEPQGDIRIIYLFGAVALLILVIACFNYVNMSTARAAKRALETGVRKVMGASKAVLIGQYFFESILLNLFALGLALMLVYLFLPYFNQLTQLHISIHSINTVWILGLLTGVLVAMSILSGAYPAILLSSFKAVPALRGKIVSVSGISLRKGLVIFQFFISVLLIISAIVLQRQMTYIQNNQPGVEGTQVIFIRTREVLTEYPSFKTELLANPQIHAVTTTQFDPGFSHDVSNFGQNDIEGFDEKSSIPIFYGDEDFVKTFGLEILKGRNFSKEFPADAQQSIVINETAAKQFGWKKPVGKYIWFKEASLINENLVFHRQQRRVIGVVKDFHYESLRKSVTPAIVEMDKGPFLYIAVQASEDNIAQTLSFIKKKWKSFVPERPLDYSFLDHDFAAMYQHDYLLGKIFKDFAILAIIIACLGLFGLITFSAEQRTKEIGIRKVLGASVSSIVSLLAKDFLGLIFIAIIVAVPVVWFGMNKWLQNFAYRIHLSWWIFFIACLSAIVIAFITISFQAIKAAMANPVDSLRSE